MNKKVAIIIVNYKDYAQNFLQECRDSLREQNYPADLFRVYIVDNASSEESRRYLDETYPEAKIISRTDGNYAAGNNAGLKQAMADGYEYFVVTNMDVKFDKDYLSELVKALESDSKIGLAQSRILLYPKTKEEWAKPNINSLGNIMHFLGFGFTQKYNMPDYDMESIIEITGYASGCSFITKKEVLEKIGFYDEEYYMYHDDVELGWRAKLAGYKIVLASKSIVYHKYEFSRSILMLYYMERNRYLAMFQYYRIGTLMLLFPVILGLEIAMIFYSIIGGWFKIKTEEIWYFFKMTTWKKIFQKRKAVKKIRIIKEREIVKNFSGKIDFQEINNPVLKYVGNRLLNMYWQIVRKLIFW